MNKVFVLDTNVILSDAEAIFNFEEHHVIIPITVIEELDKFKKDKSELGANARAFSRHMDHLRTVGDLVSANGIQYKTDYDETVRTLSVFLWEEIAHKAQNYIHSDFTIMDDRILACAYYLSQTYQKSEVTLVTNDINLRIRADIYGIKAEEYKHNRVKHSDMYTGMSTVEVTQDIIEQIYIDKSIPYSIIGEEPYPHECFILKAGKQSALCRYDSNKGLLKLIHQDLKTCGILPKSVEQQFALELLRDKNIPLVSMIGKSGSGKTLLTVAAALRAVMEFGEYEKIMLLKPIVAMDNSNQLGFAPGTINEKLSHWMYSYADNINVLMKAYFKQDENDTGKKSRKKRSFDEDKSQAKLNPVQELMELGILEFGSLEHMRGRAELITNKIPVPGGFIYMKDIKVGDRIFGSDGKLINVTGVFPQGIKDIYRVKFSDGNYIDCCDDHLWPVRNLNSRKRKEEYKIKSIKEIKDNLVYIQNNSNVLQYDTKILRAPVEYEEIDVKFDPYIIGCLIGNGCITGTNSSIGFSSADEETVQNISNLLPEHLSIVKTKNLYGYTIKTIRKDNKNELIRFLKEINLWGKYSHNKSIPDIYKYNSVENRIKLLQGLMDTDGSLFKCTKITKKYRVEYYTVSEQLSKDVKHLIESLGGIATVTKRFFKENDGSKGHNFPGFIVKINLPKNINPFRLNRKSKLYNPEKQLRLIKSIEYVGKNECQCISVDSEDHLYLTENFIVTHNTLSNTIVIIDELQNTSVSFCRSLFTRVGEGSKIIACGDVNQIDNPYLDEYSNGLSVLVNSVKHSDLTAHITLTKTERSKLAELIAETL